MPSLNVRITDEEKNKIIEDAKKLGFVDNFGEAKITAYIKFLVHNVNVIVEIEEKK